MLSEMSWSTGKGYFISSNNTVTFLDLTAHFNHLSMSAKQYVCQTVESKLSVCLSFIQVKMFHENKFKLQLKQLQKCFSSRKSLQEVFYAYFLIHHTEYFKNVYPRVRMVIVSILQQEHLFLFAIKTKKF